ncbi:MAG: 2-C-methyl-D-erythritol 4-phosphate cytidylyltransferase [Planctomycetaceae bacterium]|nr:2-C-methyl-D-erythritol 4-phosphate cytidylyltransferase [Planctomycetaceae bacterium]
MKTFAVLIMAAGESRRFSDPFTKKPFALLDNRPVWMHSAERFLKRPEVKQVILVVNPDDKEAFLRKFGANVAFLELELADGGKERFHSVENGLKQVKREIDFVAVHDAARPCLSELWIDDVFEAAIQHGAAILATPITGTIKRSRKENIGGMETYWIEETVPREYLWEAQTPQVFRKDLLEKACAERGDFKATDDAQLVQRIGQKVQIVPCNPMNIKITTKSDIKLAERILPALPKPVRF